MSSTNELYPAGGCMHLEEFKRKHLTRSYEIICGCIIACNSEEALKAKARSCICQICFTYLPRLHACMYCAFFGCYNARHIHEHALVKEHYFAVDVSHGAVYCFRCEDYVHDMDLIAILRRHKRRSAKLLGLNEQYYPWEASRTDLKILSLNPERRLITKDSFIGLRGLMNLGHTCFMNCIMHVMMHTPLLRDYFLSGTQVCKKLNQPSHDPLSCLVCEMRKLFQECYSGKTETYVPSRLLTVIWLSACHLAARDQQDAHDFFLTIVNILHKHFEGESGISKDPEEGCCIVDQIFSGKLKTDITCANCQHCTIKITRFVDISLDLGVDNEGANKAKTRGKPSEVEKSLFELLENFCNGESCSRRCSKCEKSDISRMRHAIKKLPVILSFHLQRNQQMCKRETFVTFPELMDMTQYLFSFQNSESASKIPTNNNFASSNSIANRYCLFAVVNHDGKVDGGHYTSFIRPRGNIWYKCDDEFITIATKEDVLMSKAYLLFYHKQVLDYE